MSVIRYFRVNYRDATISFDLHRTMFETEVIPDLDSNPHQIRFLGITNGSTANSFQAELNMQPIDGLDTRLAYRYLDVQQRIDGVWRQRPLVARHRMLVNLSYGFDRDDADVPGSIADLTVQWFGPKRIPSTSSNPAGYQARDHSPPFATVNAQFTRSLFGGLDLYIGGENLLDFKQDDPILGWRDPQGPYFDASLVWGPIFGRMMYAGLRYRV
jgi:hypothetical protein